MEKHSLSGRVVQDIYANDVTSHDPTAPVLPKQDYLMESQLFAGLTDAELAVINDVATMTRCARGRVFFAPEDMPETLYILKEGRVRLYRETTDGKHLTVAMLDRGAVFGESSLIGQTHSGVFAIAEEEGLLCVMPADHLRELITRIPRIGLNLLEFVGGRLRRSQELAEEVAYWSVKRRLAKLLLELNERYGHPTMGGGRIINKSFTQADLAEMIGSTRETVAEMLGTLKGLDVISSRRRKIVLEDVVELERLSNQR